MKALDEVIDQLIDCHTNWARWSQTSDIVDRSAVEDAIEYLRKYREKHDDILRMEEALGYCEIMDNPPLTWDELKAMEGKPVWIEIKKKPSLNGWRLIRSFNGAFMTTLAATCYQREFNYKTMGTEFGKTWQAFRKER